MVKIVRNTSNADELDSLRNKKVCNIDEYTADTIFGSGRGWMGSTENEFFHILFINGMLSICISEREMLLDQNGVGVGMTKELRQAVNVSKVDEEAGLLLTKEYSSSGRMDEDMDNITLKDVLEALGWELKDGAKIHYEV
jgi:hypothetical protein